MEEASVSVSQLAASSKDFARRLLTIGENRLELLTVEVQEGRERLLQAFLLALGVAAFGLLARHDVDGCHRGFVLGWLTRGRSPHINRTLWRSRSLALPPTHWVAA